MIISKDTYKGFRLAILVAFVTALNLAAQQKQEIQRIGFVDMEYVLEQIPSYAAAQSKLDTETTLWKKNLDKMYLKLETMKKEFLNEKPLLTEDLITERENEIELYQREILKTENTYFGVDGKLFELRKKLVTPYQDLVYNAVQVVAKVRKYDMVFEKSSSIVMLYTNNNYDISDLILKYIQKSEQEIKEEESALKRAEAKKARDKRIEEQRRKREEILLKRKEERLKRLNKNKNETN